MIRLRTCGMLLALGAILWLTNGLAASATSAAMGDALREAAKAGDLDEVRVLLDRGAPLNGVDDRGQTALARAAAQSHAAVVALLLARGADPGPRDGKGQSAFSLAAFRGGPGQGEILERLAWDGADLRGLDLRSLELRSNSPLRLRGLHASGAVLCFTHLQNMDFAGSDFSGADLRYADLRGCDLTGADFRGADLTGAYLQGAKLKGVRKDAATRWPASH